MTWNRLEKRLRHVLRSEDGNMLVLGGFLLIGALGFGGVALDFGQMTELRRKLQVAADVAAHEHAADPTGKNASVLQTLCRASVDECTIEIKSPAPDVAILACAPYRPYLGPIYVSLGVTFKGFTVENGRLSLCAASEARGNMCKAPPDEVRWDPVKAECPTGQTGEISYEQEIKRTASCAAGATSPEWSEQVTGIQRNQTNSCKAEPPKCATDTTRKPQFRWSETRVDESSPCKAGEYGAKFIRVRLVREPQVCPNNDEDWTDWRDWRDAQGRLEVQQPIVNTCRSTCDEWKGHDEFHYQEKQMKCSSTGPGSTITERVMYKVTYRYTCDGKKVLFNGGNAWTPGMDSYVAMSCPRGGKVFTTPGEHVWTAPEGVKNLAVLAIGGGASGSVAGPKTNTFRFGAGEKTEILTSPSLSANGGGYDAKLIDGQNYYNLPGNAGGCQSVKDGGGCGGWGGQNRWWGGVEDQYNQPYYFGKIRSSGTQLFTYGGGGGGAAGFTNASPHSGAGGMNGGDNGFSNRSGNKSSGAHGGYARGGGGGIEQNITGGGGGGVGLLNYNDDGRWAGSPQGASGGGGGSRGQSAERGTNNLNTGSVMRAPSGGAYGGGGGGVLAPKTPMSWDSGFGGGGGELAYKNDVSLPQGVKTVTIKVGKGGAAPDPVERRDGDLVFHVQPGSGASGAARIIWGDGCTQGQSRKFPDDFSKFAPFLECKYECTSKDFCAWEE